MLKQTRFLFSTLALIASLFVGGMNNAQANNVELKMWDGFRDKVVAGGTIVAVQPVTYTAPVNSNTYVILAHDPFHWHPFYIYHHRPHRPRWHPLPPPPPRRDFHRPEHRPPVHKPMPKPPVMHRPPQVHRPMPGAGNKPSGIHRPMSKPGHRPSVHRPAPRPRPQVKPAPRPQRRDEIYQSAPNRQHATHRPGGGRHHGGAGHRSRR